MFTAPAEPGRSVPQPSPTQRAGPGRGKPGEVGAPPRRPAHRGCSEATVCNKIHGCAETRRCIA
eukprot:4801774-Alexandrium_andersonii.AAC.1